MKEFLGEVSLINFTGNRIKSQYFHYDLQKSSYIQLLLIRGIKSITVISKLAHLLKDVIA